MDYITAVGFLAATLTTISFFPQLLKVWRTKSTQDISLGTFSLTCTGIFLWFIYGALLENWPMIISNSFGFLQALIILLFKVKYK